MKRLVLAAVICVACGSRSAPDAPDAAATPKPLVFERWSPAQPSSYDVVLAAQGSIVITANRVSRDGGATWATLDPRLGEPGRVAIDGTTVLMYAPGLGLARWDAATGQLATVADAPRFAGERTWRREPGTGRLLVFDPIENAVAVERPTGWATAALPRPAPTECCPYIADLESNGTAMLTVSGWGVHRSTDGGATWQRAAVDLPGAGRDLLVLGDGRFALVGGATTYLFGTTGEPAGTLASLVLGDDQAAVCDGGAIITTGAGSASAGGPARVAPGQVTRDLGATWQPLATAGALELITERAACSSTSTWVLLRSASWGYRLIRYDAPGTPGIAAGNWDAAGAQAWTSGGPSIVRTDDGTFLAGGLAWRSGDDAWTLREMPARTWASGGVLLGTAGAKFYLSRDAGASWTPLAAAGLGATDPDSFARTADGALYIGQFASESSGSVDTWRATVWRSVDLGATWSVAYDGVATRSDGKDTGEAHRFVGITADGTWVATDAISTDAGATWHTTGAEGDRSLAHLMYDGSLVMQPADASGEIWRVYAGGGDGDLLATHAIEADGQPVLAAELRSVAFDAEGHAYVARGTPHVQIWRSTTPLQHPTGTRQR